MTDIDLARHFAPPRYRAGGQIVELRTHRPIVMIEDGRGDFPGVDIDAIHRRRPYIPLGCDQQGRVTPTREVPPPAAAAHSDQGCAGDDLPPRPPMTDADRVWLVVIAVACAAIAATWVPGAVRWAWRALS